MQRILHTLNSRPSDCHRGELDLPLARVEMVSGDTARTPDEGWTAGSQSTEYSGTAIRLVSTSAARFSRAVLPPRPTQHNKAAHDCRFGGLIRSCIVGTCGERNGHAVVRKNSAGHRSECR